MTSTSLPNICTNSPGSGGFVCFAESEDELFLFEDGFSEEMNDPNWKLLTDIV